MNYSINKGNISVALLSIIALVFAIGGFGLGYLTLSNPSPEEVLHKMMASVSSLNSFSPSVSVKTETVSDKEKSTTSYDASIDLDISDPGNGQFRASLNSQGGSEELPLSINAQIILKDKIYYLKIDSGTSIGPFSLDSIADQWVKFDTQKASDKSAISSIGLVNIPTSTTLEITSQEMSQFRELIKNAFIFKDIVDLGKEEINGVKTYHYGFVPDDAALDLFTKESAKLLHSEYQPKSASTSEDLFSQARFEIWMGTKDYLPRKMTVAGLVKDTEKGNVSGSAVLTFSNFNSIPPIQAIADAKPIEEVLESLLNSLFSGFNTSSSNKQ